MTIISDCRESRGNNSRRDKDLRSNGSGIIKDKKSSSGGSNNNNGGGGSGNNGEHHHYHHQHHLLNTDQSNQIRNRSNRSHQFKTYLQQGPRSPN